MPTAFDIFALVVAADESLVAAGSGGNLSYSTDHGATWGSSVETPTTNNLFLLLVAPDDALIVAGSGGHLFRENTLVASLNESDAWVAEYNAPGEIMLTAAYPGARPVPESTDLTFTTVNPGSPNRAFLELKNGDRRIWGRVYEDELQAVAVDYDANEYVGKSFPRSPTGWSLFHIGHDGANELYVQANGNHDTVSLAALNLNVAADELQLILDPTNHIRISETWLRTDGTIPAEEIQAYYDAGFPFGEIDIDHGRIQAPHGMDMNYATTGGGVHRFQGPVDIGGSTVLEVIVGYPKGQTIDAVSGAYTLENVSGVQNLTDTHTKVDGSVINYRPPEGTKRVEYEFHFQWASPGGSGSLYHMALEIDQTQVQISRQSEIMRSTNDTTSVSSFHSVIEIKESDDIANGIVGPWNSWRELRLTARRYSSSWSVRLFDHYWWNGSNINPVFKPPVIKVTAYR